MKRGHHIDKREKRIFYMVHCYRDHLGIPCQEYGVCTTHDFWEATQQFEHSRQWNRFPILTDSRGCTWVRHGKDLWRAHGGNIDPSIAVRMRVKIKERNRET